MGHAITALIVAEPFDEDAARSWDVTGAPIGCGLRLVHITLAYAAYQQHQRRTGSSEGTPPATAAPRGSTLDVPGAFPPVFPRDAVLADLAAAVTGRSPATFALVMTDYFGGAGSQWATVFTGGRPAPGVRDINGALRVLGVHPTKGKDEFDTVGLSRHRSTPDTLDRYQNLCDTLGI